MAVLGGAAHRDGVDAVGVPIAGAVVPFSSSIPGGPDKDGAQTLAALHEARRRGGCHQLGWDPTGEGLRSCLQHVPPQGSDGAPEPRRAADGLHLGFSGAILPVVAALRSQMHKILSDTSVLHRKPQTPVQAPPVHTTSLVSTAVAEDQGH